MVKTVVLTAGASAPEVLVEDVVNYLRQKGFGSVEEVEVMPENVRFGLPPGDCAGDRGCSCNGPGWRIISGGARLIRWMEAGRLSTR